jgi:glycosyltransferase involved in cell wall biosynthesis
VAGSNPRERTALILTVLNEADSVCALMDSIEQQRLAPDEVIVVDGGSEDGTLTILDQWSTRLPMRVVEAPGANISQGRNLAIRATNAELIAVTDAGVRLEPDWLEQLRAHLVPGVDVVSGFFRADPRTPFERALGATTLPTETDVDPESFLPSSRSVLFRREAWQRVGGYPEWLDYCEDLVFDFGLRRSGAIFEFVPSAIVWFRPRKSLRAFFRQYFLYARGDGKADLWRRRHAIRYATYFCAAIVLLKQSRLAWLLPLGVVAYTRKPYRRLLAQGLSPEGAALVPVIRLVGDVAKMLGYPVGVWWRLRRRVD